MKILKVLVGNMWMFSFHPLNRFKNYVYTRCYKAANAMCVGRNVIFQNSHMNAKAYLKIGKDFRVDHYSLIDYSGGIEIEDAVILSDGVRIYTHIHNIDNRILPHQAPPIEFSPLKIGKGAFFGAGSIVMGSVSYIGKGASIGAGSVVINDVPDNKVALGNPARIIKERTLPPAE